MPYVVTQPDSVRGIYDSWVACKAAVSGVPGARYQKVTDRQEAQAILSGAGVVLGPGLYAFTDGNGQGGVGVVLVRMAADKGSQPQVIQEIATSVGEVFLDSSIPGLDSDQAVGAELGRLANILAELAGLYRALSELPKGALATIVHDYEGVGAWMERRWRLKDSTVTAVVSACRSLAESRGLNLSFVQQRGHMSTWTGRHDLARLNGRADELAAEGSSSSSRGED